MPGATSGHFSLNNDRSSVMSLRAFLRVHTAVSPSKCPAYADRSWPCPFGGQSSTVVKGIRVATRFRTRKRRSASPDRSAVTPAKKADRQCATRHISSSANRLLACGPHRENPSRASFAWWDISPKRRRRSSLSGAPRADKTAGKQRRWPDFKDGMKLHYWHYRDRHAPARC
jgi:hypothetical protein